MNARLCLALLIFVFMSVSPPQPALSQVPTLWSKAEAASSQIFPMYAWRSVEAVLEKASKQEIQEFVAWVPEFVFMSGDDEDIFLFIWTRLDDRGEANIGDLNSRKLPWPDTVSPHLIKLKMTKNHDLLLKSYSEASSPTTTLILSTLVLSNVWDWSLSSMSMKQWPS